MQLSISTMGCLQVNGERVNGAQKAARE